jgi:DNA-binding transcriptional MerR regulator
LGEDDRHISTVDEEGVALAAIKAIHAENVSLKSDNASLHEAHRADEARLAQLERRLDALETRLMAAAK